MTRPVDQAFEQSVAFATKEKNALLCDRMHSYKSKYFRLDIVVGKVNFMQCTNYFSDEDMLVKQIYEQNKEYEDRLNLGMIPFFKQRLDFINEELISADNPPTENEKKFLLQVFNEVNEKFKTEKSELNDLANKIYDTWVEIKDVRSK